MTILNRSAEVLGTIVICCLSVFPSMAQNGGTSTNSRGKTSAEVLRDYGIELSQESLIAALSNPNPRIRVNAAMQLAADHDSDAIPAIQSAYSNEKDSMIRVGIAGALASLHDASGTQHLQAVCADSASPVRAVISAVWMLRELNESSSGCAGNVLTLLVKEVDYRDSTLALLPIVYRGASHEMSDQILKAIEGMLADSTQQPSVRMAAGNALAQIGVPSSDDAIRDALSREDDPAVRANLELDLDLLEKKQGTGAKNSPN